MRVAALLTPIPLYLTLYTSYSFISRRLGMGSKHIDTASSKCRRSSSFFDLFLPPYNEKDGTVSVSDLNLSTGPRCSKFVLVRVRGKARRAYA